MERGQTKGASVRLVGADVPRDVLDAAADAGFDVERVASAESDGLADCVVVADVDSLRAVRARDADVPVVLCAPAEGSLLRDAVAEGVTEYVPLADAADGLEAAVERALGRSEAGTGDEADVDDADAAADNDTETFADAFRAVNSASVVVLDADWRVVWSNVRARHRLGFEEGEKYVAGDTDVYDEDGAFVPPEERPYLRVFETGEPVFDWEAQIAGTEGRRWISLDAVPVFGDGDGDGEDGEVTHVAVSAEDVTERRAARERLEAERRELAAELDATLERASEAFVSIDGEGRVAHVNDRGASLLGVDAADVIGRRPSDVFPVLPETSLGAALERARETGESTTETAYFPPADGWFTADFYPSESGVSVYFRDVTERRERQRELETQRERLAALNDVDSLVGGIAESVVEQSTREEIETLVTARLADSDSFAFAWVGDVDDDGEFFVRAEAGVDGYLSELSLSVEDEPGRSGPTATAYRTGEVQVVHDVGTDPDYDQWSDHAEAYGYRSSAAVPLAFDGENYGVLNVYSARRGAFAAEERETFSRLGTIVAHALESVERRRRYRTLAENVPNGAVSLVNEDLQFELVAGRMYDRLDVSPSDLTGKTVRELSYVDDDVTERLVRQYRTALDGERTRTEFELDGRVVVVHTVPIRDENGEVTELMSLSQDVTERKRRQQELERERERLELMNRLLRHNFLNSLNVVDARLEFLEGNVDEGVETHLETVRSRTADMIDLIESIRSLMQSLVGTETQQLEAVPADSIVETEVRAARERFPEAEFTFEGEPADVEANGLLNEVVENLLINAVQHNDKETPRVHVAVDSDDETVSIAVSDNGPGISEEMQSAVFESGAKRFENPGTGFGLHLVREIVEGYGGEVTVDDAGTGTGTDLRVSLPRAYR